MRVRILTPPADTIAGVSPGDFDVRGVYDIRSQVACVYLAHGWAEAVGADVALTHLALPSAAATHIKALVLVLEDEAPLRRLARQLVTYRGYQAVPLKHGEEPIERLRAHYRGVTVLDLAMPMGGRWTFHVEQVLLTDSKLTAAPVLFQSGEWGRKPGVPAMPAIGILRAPVDPEAILEALA